MEEQSFALMLRQALTEYDFESIDISSQDARVLLKREVYAENGDETVEYRFSDPILMDVLGKLKSYLPML